MNWNICDITLNKSTLALINHCTDLLEEGKEKSDAIKLIKREICGLLNTRGGVILSDCERNNMSVIPRGSFLIKKEILTIKK